jgi:hypothetical protein
MRLPIEDACSTDLAWVLLELEYLMKEDSSWNEENERFFFLIQLYEKNWSCFHIYNVDLDSGMMLGQ